MSRRVILPIIIIELYLSISLLLFEYGPILFPKTNKEPIMVMLVIVYQLAIFFGYLFGRQGKTNQHNRLNLTKAYNVGKVNSLITTALILSVFFSIASFVRYVGSISVLSWINAIVNGFKASGDAYKYNMTINGSSIFTKLSTLLVGFYYIGIPLGMLFYKELNRLNKILFPLAVVLEMGSFIIRGTNIGIFRVILSLACIIYIKGEFKIGKKNKLLIAVGIIFFLCYFTSSIASRMGSSVIPSTVHGIPVDFDQGIGVIVPVSLRYAFLSISSYISQGYYGMMLALDKPFTTTYGLGNSTFLLENMPLINSESIYHRSYIYKISEVWSDRINWSTAYTWFANDIGFVGVIILMFLLGFLFRKVINRVIEGDIYAVLLVPLYVQMLLFLPCNNSVLSNPITFMPFVFMHFIWLIKANHIKIRFGVYKIWNEGLFRI